MSVKFNTNVNVDMSSLQSKSVAPQNYTLPRGVAVTEIVFTGVSLVVEDEKVTMASVTELAQTLQEKNPGLSEKQAAAIAEQASEKVLSLATGMTMAVTRLSQKGLRTQYDKLAEEIENAGKFLPKMKSVTSEIYEGRALEVVPVFMTVWDGLTMEPATMVTAAKEEDVFEDITF